MASRQQLQTKLEELNGNRNVYYQPPSSVEMQYDAIRYSKKKPDVKRANNAVYTKLPCYEIIVISRRPDSPVVDAIMELPFCEFDRHYTANNLHHDVLTLYF